MLRKEIDPGADARFTDFATDKPMSYFLRGLTALLFIGGADSRAFVVVEDRDINAVRERTLFVFGFGAHIQDGAVRSEELFERSLPVLRVPVL